MSRQKKFFYQRAKAYLSLESKLYNLYLKRDFFSLNDVILNFLQNELPLFFDIKVKYKIYNQAVAIEFNKFQENYLPSLAKLSDENLIARSKIDAELLVNMPSQMLFAYHKFQQNREKLLKKEEQKEVLESEEEEKELLALILLLSFNPITRGGKALKKILASDTWNSVFSKNSRASHMSASGQKRGNDGYFLVGGELFRYPADWSMASIGNVINCLCYLTTKNF